MAKDNLFLGMARGKVGDVVFSRLNGVQVSRARNRAPHNPQSPAQMVQRIIMSSVGKAYSFMQGICNHSFEGFETGQQSQRKFMEVNVGILRDKCADVLAYPVEEVIRTSEAFNFSFKNDYAPVLNQYMLSSGTLAPINLVMIDGEGYISRIPIDLGSTTPAGFSYAQLVQALGLQRGDQLTFIQASHDGSKSGHDADLLTGFRYARVILEPADGDMSVPFLANGAINNPNPRNEGTFGELAFVSGVEGQPSGLSFRVSEISSGSTSDRAVAGSAVILSRQVGGRWFRSTQFLMPRLIQGPQQLKSSTLGLAYDTYRIGAASDLYLNQAE